MESLHRSLARLTGRPYRTAAAETSLEVLVRHGPLPPVKRELADAGPVLGLLGALALVALAALGPIGSLVVMAFGARLVYEWKVGSGSFQGLAALRARIERYPLPVTGHIGRWLEAGELRLGAFELVLRERHPLVEATVRLCEPDAALSWTSDTTLRVHPRWSRDELDLKRLDRLVLLLGLHREELGLERIELVAH